MSEHTKIKNKNNETIKAGCVVLNENNEVLLVSSDGGKIWTFPKGHAENGETLEEVALREVKEETGYGVEISKRLSDLTYTHGQTGELIRVAMFKSKPVKKINDGEKDIQSKWFSLKKAEEALYSNLAFLLKELN
ncbi:MAG: NUDIX domain-containing protein [Minisyncoccia bacterium]